ncbi:MAG: CCA tRNA nucleotidyltransferase [Lachnospiraceae bacterium]|nr:CCA tRNA nucleotidyltransferase [Lachnospiraceae bacterium]
MLFTLPENVSEIIRRLEEAGFEAYAVGGCVRDMLLSQTPKDWDITTNAEPEDVKEVFKRTVDTGIKHGTVTVLFNEGAYEVTTYRIDGKYEDSRHPSKVTFTKSLREDLLRRDFTINAMAFNYSSGLVDCFGGQKDLENGVIRCVGDAHSRFGEDALRILRAFRFAARLGFKIDPDTEAAAADLSDTLKNISAERIREEITKTLVSETPFELQHMHRLGILKEVLPRFEPLFSSEGKARYVLNSIKSAIDGGLSEGDRTAYAWAVLSAAAAKVQSEAEPLQGRSLNEYCGTAEQGLNLPELSKLFATRTLHDLKFDNDTIRTAGGLAKAVFTAPLAGEEAVRRNMSTMGNRIFDLWLAFLATDGLEEGQCDRETAEKVRACAENVRSRKDPVALKDLAVTGRDLIENGATSGVLVGACLSYLLDRVLSEPGLNTRETLLSLAGAYFANEEQSENN